MLADYTCCGRRSVQSIVTQEVKGLAALSCELKAALRAQVASNLLGVLFQLEWCKSTVDQSLAEWQLQYEQRTCVVST